jgi:hypothetical protein
MASDEMPNLPRERDPLLLAASAAEYVGIVVRLLRDGDFMRARRAAAAEIAAAQTDTGSAYAEFRDAIAWSARRVFGD